MLKKFNELSLKDKAYLIGGLILLVIVIAGSVIGISYHHSKTQDLRSRIAEAEATINIKDKELVQYEEQVQQLKQEAKQ